MTSKMNFERLEVALKPLVEAYVRFVENLNRAFINKRPVNAVQRDAISAAQLALLKAQKAALDLKAEGESCATVKELLLAQSSLTSLRIEQIEGLRRSSI
jgi:phage-related tail protein